MYRMPLNSAFPLWRVHSTAKLMLRRGKNADKTYTIVLGLSHKGKNTEISLNKSVDSDFWDKDAKGRVKKDVLNMTTSG